MRRLAGAAAGALVVAVAATALALAVTGVAAPAEAPVDRADAPAGRMPARIDNSNALPERANAPTDRASAPAGRTDDPRRSGFDFMTPEVRAMQQDEAANPGMLWVKDGEALWNRVDGAAARSCAACHGDAPTAMRGVAARYPAFDNAASRPFTVAQRVDACRARHQQAAPWAAESQERLALEAYVASQSRGLPIAPPADARLDAARARGERLYRQRIGQLDLACAQCHDANAGQRLAGSVIPQAHPTGYPIYRLEWQGVGSLERRLRGCMSGVRAEPFAYDSAAMVDLEAYLAQRATGMTIETPAVRP